MGWLYGFYSPKEIKENALKSFTAPDCKLELMAVRATKYGRHLWIAVKYKDTGVSGILFYLINGNRHEWGYKDMDEDCGPCEIDCPLDLIEMTTGFGGEYGMKWRETVKAYHAARKALNKEVAPGKIVLVHGRPARLIERVNAKTWRIEWKGGIVRCSQDKMRLIDNSAVEFIVNKLGGSDGLSDQSQG